MVRGVVATDTGLIARTVMGRDEIPIDRHDCCLVRANVLVSKNQLQLRNIG